MQIIITGGAGFLGQRLAKALLKSSLAFDELVLVDIVLPDNPGNDNRISCLQADLSKEGAAQKLIQPETGFVFHLAAVVSSQAEKEFDLGWKVNLDTTRNLLEACRHQHPGIRFVFASGMAVYGGQLPPVINEATVVTPQSSYGTQKAIAELLINDYSRKNFVDGRVLRLPTICVRPGRPNLAASSFLSSIIREPINGEKAVCPVSPDLPVLLASPDTIIENILKGATLAGADFGGWRTVNMPAVGVTVQEMLDSLERIAGKETRARVEFRPDPAINAIVSSWPGAIDNSRALGLGFNVDGPFDGFITQFIAQNEAKPD
ncbi:D-erythronate dehydrogenase [Larkinella terrae]|uniref:NAD-dependent epimerase/dehydratase family protein n=1 Tax=Larkinella terrae TaxID=2025311 RepID=A0A7K0EE82_9BACT|nr:D-erythronate dehydrogenase [Larkinella terrae]MRS60012.1 NAD-dependent epimerase/dehydratase family protein [Larkinella terrae]